MRAEAVGLKNRGISCRLLAFATTHTKQILHGDVITILGRIGRNNKCFYVHMLTRSHMSHSHHS